MQPTTSSSPDTTAGGPQGQPSAQSSSSPHPAGSTGGGPVPHSHSNSRDAKATEHSGGPHSHSHSHSHSNGDKDDNNTSRDSGGEGEETQRRLSTSGLPSPASHQVDSPGGAHVTAAAAAAAGGEGEETSSLPTPRAELDSLPSASSLGVRAATTAEGSKESLNLHLDPTGPSLAASGAKTNRPPADSGDGGSPGRVSHGSVHLSILDSHTKRHTGSQDRAGDYGGSDGPHGSGGPAAALFPPPSPVLTDGGGSDAVRRRQQQQQPHPLLIVPPHRQGRGRLHNDARGFLFDEDAGSPRLKAAPKKSTGSGDDSDAKGSDEEEWLDLPALGSDGGAATSHAASTRRLHTTAASTFIVDSELMAHFDEGKPEEMKVSKHGQTFYVRQRRGDKGRMEFDNTFLLLKKGDAVSFVWFSPDHHIFEVNNAYTKALPKGRHSCFQDGQAEAREEADDALAAMNDTGGAGALNVTGRSVRFDTSNWRPAAGGYRTFTVSFTRPGNYYFICSLDKKRMRLHVQVLPSSSHRLLFLILASIGLVFAVGLIVLVLLVLTFWLQKKDLFLTRENASSDSQYQAVKDIQKIISFRFFPFFALGILLVLVIAIAAIVYSCVRCFHRTREGIHHRGVKPKYRKISSIITTVLAVIIIVFMFASYGVQLDVCDALNTFANQLVTSIVDTVNLFQICVQQADWLLDEAPTIFNDTSMTAPLGDVKEIVDSVGAILNETLSFTRKAEDLVQGAIRLLPLLLFFVLQYSCFVCIFVAGALFVRYSRPANAAVWMLAVSVGIYACAIGVVFAEQGVLKLLYDTGTEFNDSPQELVIRWGASQGSVVSELFGLCDVQTVQMDGIINITNDLLVQINNTLSPEGQEAFSAIFSIINSVLPVGIEALVNYTDYVMLNLDILDEIVTTESTNPDSPFTQNIVPFLRVVVSLLQNLLSLVNCQVFRDVIGNALYVVRVEVRGKVNVLFGMLIALFSLSFVIAPFSAFSAYAIKYQLKNWYEPCTGRWFRFHYSYKVHHRTLAQAPTEKRQALRWQEMVMGSQKPFMYRLTIDKLVLYTAALLAVFNCLLLALFNEMSTHTEERQMGLLRAQAYLGAAFLLVLLLAGLFRTVWLRRAITFFALLIVVAAFVIALTHTCFAFSNLKTCDSGSYDNVDAFTACPVAVIGYNVEVGVYTLVAVVNYVTVIVTTVVLIVYTGRMAPHLRKRPYVGAWSFLGRKFAWIGRLMLDQLNVKRVYVAIAIFFTALLIALLGIIDSPGLQFIGGRESGPLLDAEKNIIRVIDPTVGCNGDARYCDLRVSEIIWACAHNAHSSSEDGFVVANHYYNISWQLKAGIRSFMIDLWYDKATPNSTKQEIYVCHTVCFFGRRPLSAVLEEFRSFLEDYPEEVIMIIVEQYVNSSDVGVAVEAANMTQYSWYSTEPQAPNYNPNYAWPTLGEIVAKNQRVMWYNDVTATSDLSLDGTPPWYYYSFDYQYENTFATASVLEWNCAITRGWCSKSHDINPWAACRCEEYFNGTLVLNSSDSSSSSLSSSGSSLSGSEDADPNDGNLPGCNCTDLLKFNETEYMEQHLADITDCALFTNHSSYSNGSAVYNSLYHTNPPNVRSKMSTLNHIITNEIGSPVQATRANIAEGVRFMTYNCSQQWNQIVNIIAVDFWNINNPLQTIQTMNQNMLKIKKWPRTKTEWAKGLLGSSTLPTNPYGGPS